MRFWEGYNFSNLKPKIDILQNFSDKNFIKKYNLNAFEVILNGKVCNDIID
jgi:hypothetical protein